MIIHAFIQDVARGRKGFTLLLMIVLLTAFLSIGIGIVNILLGQVIIIGQAQESFKALYAADIAMERTLYRDRRQNDCNVLSNCSNGPIGNLGTAIYLSNGACYWVNVQLGPTPSCAGLNMRCVEVTGQDVCDGRQRFVRRSFNVRYQR